MCTTSSARETPRAEQPWSALEPHLIEELRRIASRELGQERRASSLRPTELVNEAYLRLARQHALHPAQRTLVLSAAAKIMRNLLVDRARRRRAQKRGEGVRPLELQPELLSLGRDSLLDVLDLDEALGELERRDAQRGRIAELTLYSDLSQREIAQVLRSEGEDLSEDAVGRRWRSACAWLAQRLQLGRE